MVDKVAALLHTGPMNAYDELYDEDTTDGNQQCDGHESAHGVEYCDGSCVTARRDRR